MLARIVNGSSEIVRVRLRDGAEQAVTATPRRTETWPYWSSVAERLVFQVAADAGPSDLVLWSAEAGETPLTRTPRRDERWPTWSPRTPNLIYAFRGGQPAAGLAAVNVLNGKSQSVAGSGAEDYFFRPDFSPDGRRLVMQRRSEGRGSSLWLARLGAPPRPLSPDPRWYDTKPFFSRDGGRIFFSRRPASGGPRDVLSMTSEGGDLRSHASLPDADDHSGRPSPTRDELVLVSDREGHRAVYLVDLPDGSPRRLSPAELDAVAPRWSPDGERVAVTIAPPGVREPRLRDLDSLARTRVLVLDREGRVLLDVPGYMPDWMPPWP